MIQARAIESGSGAGRTHLRSAQAVRAAMPMWYSMRVRQLPTSYLLNWPRRFGRDERPTGRRAARPGRTAGAGALGTLQELRQVLTAAGPALSKKAIRVGESSRLPLRFTQCCRVPRGTSCARQYSRWLCACRTAASKAATYATVSSRFHDGSCVLLVCTARPSGWWLVCQRGWKTAGLR